MDSDYVALQKARGAARTLYNLRRQKEWKAFTMPKRKMKYGGKWKRRTVRKRAGPYRRKKAAGFQEKKFKDTAAVDNIVPTGGVITGSMNLVAQGVGDSQRIGRKIIVRSIAARFTPSLPSENDVGNIGPGDNLRVIIYIDHQANGANAAVLDILETAAADSYRNLAKNKRFTILGDHTWSMNRIVAMSDGTNTASTPLTMKYWKFFKGNLNIEVEFDGTAGVIAEVSTNNIGFLYITEFGFAGFVAQQTRIRYDG